MKKQYILLIVLLAIVGFVRRGTAQQDESRLHVVVNLVQLNVAVTDHKNNYVTNLHPTNFLITEDGIPETIASFEEGNGPTDFPLETANTRPPQSPLTGANVFILFDTSNYMYRGFVFAQDAIAAFIRSLDSTNRVAFYSYSRDLFRAAQLTADRAEVVHGVRITVAGDDAALYNALLLTIKDASQQPGRKVIVVFSNGPDNSSMVPPEDVAEFAQSTGIPIYMVSTTEAHLEPVSTTVFERMSAATGGKAYFAKDWRDEKKAFSSIRDDLAHLYSLSYYPKPNPNRGWRSIKVKLVGEQLSKCHIRTRNGYRPQPARLSTIESTPSAQIGAAPQNKAQ